MILHCVTDWDKAYANGNNIPGGDGYPAQWTDAAAAFRERWSAEGKARLDIAYEAGSRNRLDLFLPAGTPRGLVVIIHGGWWLAFDKSFWSHLAAGPLARGFAVAMPSYTLCPEARIAEIGLEIAAAIECAAREVDGPIHLTGHSAGGHLAARMVTASSPLSEAVLSRIGTTLPISGLHDLRPLMNLSSNATLHIDHAEALAESPALLAPRAGTRLICWVGAAERAEFIRLNALLANIWTGFGIETAVVEEPDRHHFNVIDGLTDPDHPMTRMLVGD
ncbi:MAG TPA: alpha/beta hydrolase [Mesorhizobium sp.]